ncbi:hypothetical protein [Paracraurococcus lichenis]|uniref:Uncharacterized protein n=1 Tax=Paracraurococcus lichenis TaxID=3064888 RepID=A0ABT9E4B7_9PROT|nr:hypothetical protein [Paracraurococcus sp. LOR1-02]MDO9711025.1 hypothetical protein [Paracraurococcus sp. LOR1-02]
MARVLGFALLLFALGLAAYASWSAWDAAGEVEIGFHGVVAMLLGAVFTLLLAGGLVALMLFSRRRGYDDEAAEGMRRHQRD